MIFFFVENLNYKKNVLRTKKSDKLHFWNFRQEKKYIGIRLPTLHQNRWLEFDWVIDDQFEYCWSSHIVWRNVVSCRTVCHNSRWWMHNHPIGIQILDRQQSNLNWKNENFRIVYKINENANRNLNLCGFCCLAWKYRSTGLI